MVVVVLGSLRSVGWGGDGDGWLIPLVVVVLGSFRSVGK